MRVYERERAREQLLMVVNQFMTTMMNVGFSFSNLQSIEVAVALLVVLLGVPFAFTVHTLLFKWWCSRRARRILEAQGVKVLPRSFIHGNMAEVAAMLAKAQSEPMPCISHDIVPHVLPHLFHWSKMYGKHLAFWIGFQACYILKEPEQARELLSSKFGHFRKLTARPDIKDMFGDGLATVEGKKWAQHRCILNNAFFLDKLKAMAPTMVTLTIEMMENWEPHLEGQEAIDVAEEFRQLTANIIAHTAFGSSFAEGKRVFEMQHEQQILSAKLSAAVYIPGSCFLPTPHNRYRSHLKQGIHGVLSRIIKKRMQLKEGVKGSDAYGNDLLGLMLAANKGELHGNQQNLSMTLDELIDECKTFFFAGHETLAALLTFMFLLLAIHPEWQERLRQEIFEACGKSELPTAESLNQMKLVSMVINETLRLYPPAVMIPREVDVDMKLGKTLVPAGSVIIVPIMIWHHDEQFWGPDAKEFHPERFEEGVAKACKVPGAYLPFSIGPRNCIGQQFANIEAKMVLAIMLQRYRFQLSPEYMHAPMNLLTLQPQFGMPIIFAKL